MGRVYLALDEQNDRQIAIKVLPEHFLEDKKKSEYLRRELQIARELDHPNVIDIFDIIELRRKSDGKVQGFMLMEFIDGANIRDYIRLLLIGESLKVGMLSQKVLHELELDSSQRVAVASADHSIPKDHRDPIFGNACE